MKKIFPVILLLAAFTLSACGNQKIDGGATTVNNEKSETSESKKSLKELLGLNTTQKCSYEVSQNGEVTKGEIIVSGKKFKQTTEITNKEGTTKVYAISDGSYYYSWSDAMKGNGTKMKIEDVEEENNDNDNVEIRDNGNTGETEEETINMNEKIDYRCTAATLNDSDLVIPSDIKFIDYSEMMNGLQNGNMDDFKKLIPSEEE